MRQPLEDITQRRCFIQETEIARQRLGLTDTGGVLARSLGVSARGVELQTRRVQLTRHRAQPIVGRALDLFDFRRGPCAYAGNLGFEGAASGVDLLLGGAADVVEHPLQLGDLSFGRGAKVVVFFSGVGTQLRELLLRLAADLVQPLLAVCAEGCFERTTQARQDAFDGDLNVLV